MTPPPPLGCYKLLHLLCRGLSQTFSKKNKKRLHRKYDNSKHDLKHVPGGKATSKLLSILCRELFSHIKCVKESLAWLIKRKFTHWTRNLRCAGNWGAGERLLLTDRKGQWSQGDLRILVPVTGGRETSGGDEIIKGKLEWIVSYLSICFLIYKSLLFHISIRGSHL